MTSPSSQTFQSRMQGEHAGFIFMCNRTSKPECFIYRVFGLPAAQKNMVAEIKPGDALFLFDIELKLLYGIYEATSVGKLNWQPAAFSGRFPAQVQFQICQDCLPLPESVFRQAIQHNYRSLKFDQKLSAEQVEALKLLFRPISLQASIPVPSPHENVMLRHTLASSQVYNQQSTPVAPQSHSSYAPRYERYGQNGLASSGQIVGGPQNTFAQSTTGSQPQTHMVQMGTQSSNQEQVVYVPSAAVYTRSASAQPQGLSYYVCPSKHQYYHAPSTHQEPIVYGTQYAISQHMNQSAGGIAESESATQRFVGQHQPYLPSAPVHTTSANAQPRDPNFYFGSTTRQYYHAPLTHQVNATSYCMEPTIIGSSAVVQGHSTARSVQGNGSSNISQSPQVPWIGRTSYC